MVVKLADVVVGGVDGSTLFDFIASIPSPVFISAYIFFVTIVA